MSHQEDEIDVFEQLKHILKPYAGDLVVVKDAPDDYYLNTAHIMKNKKPLFFGAVQIKKRYVSFHLMPVYVFPDLLDGLSDKLIKRMQGKSYFNFTQVDEALFSALSELTNKGYQRYKSAGYV